MDIFFLILIFLACVLGATFCFCIYCCLRLCSKRNRQRDDLEQEQFLSNIAPIRGVYEGWVASSSATSFTS